MKQVWGIAHIGKFVARRLFSSVSCTCVNVHAVATSSRGRVAVVGPSCAVEDAGGAAECGVGVADADEDGVCPLPQRHSRDASLMVLDSFATMVSDEYCFWSC